VWDAGNLEKYQSHGVTITEIEHVLDNDPFLVPDYEHSEQEDRNIAVGNNHSGRPVFVVFTIRMRNGREVVRPIWALNSHRREIERYARLWRQKGPQVQDR
jgi:uncharacterized DUF497 family protein